MSSLKRFRHWVDKSMWGSKTDYDLGESLMADICIRNHDKVVELQKNSKKAIPERAKADEAALQESSHEHAAVEEGIMPADSSECAEIVGESSPEGLGERCESVDDASLKESLDRARQYLALCSVGDEKVEQLITHFQSIVDRHYKMRDADFNVSSWVVILGFLVSYSNVLIRVLDGDRAGQIAYIIFFLTVLLVFLYMPFIRRRRKWRTAVSEGNLQKLEEVLSDLTAYYLMDSKELRYHASRRVQDPGNHQV